MAGLRADVLPPSVFFEPGSFASASSGSVIDVNNTITIDPTGTGIGGRDRVAPFANGQGVFFYLLSNPAGAVVGLCSPGYNYGDVIVPGGYTLLRKHPFMCCYRSGWGGIPSFHFEGIQNPRIRLTYPYALASLTNAPNVPTTFDLSPYIPAAGGARMALLRTIVRAAGSTAGTGYIGPDGGHMVPVGTANPTDGLQSVNPVEVRCQSNGSIAFVVNAPNVFIDVILEGWVVTEVTN